MSQVYVPARDKYKPCGKTRFLLIAESPPASGGYFYFHKSTGRDSLFRETMKALTLFPENGKMQKDFDKVPLLKEFQSRGFFLVDASYSPVNKIPKSNERKRAVIRDIPRLVVETMKLNPEKIIIVKRSIFDPIRKALEQAGFGEKILNKAPLPFPSHGHQGTYRKRLRELVESSC